MKRIVAILTVAAAGMATAEASAQRIGIGAAVGTLADALHK